MAGISGTTITATSFWRNRHDGDGGGPDANHARSDRARGHCRDHTYRGTGDRGRRGTHGAFADDPRSARLPGGAVRRARTQADRPFLRGAGGTRLRVFRRGRHPPRRHLLLERPLQQRRRHRSHSRPVHDVADLPRRASDRIQSGVRPPRRRRRRGAREPADPCHRHVDRRAGGAADQDLREGQDQRGGVRDHRAQFAPVGTSARRSRCGNRRRQAGQPAHRGDGRTLRRPDPRGRLRRHHRQLRRDDYAANCSPGYATASTHGRTTSRTTASRDPGCMRCV